MSAFVDQPVGAILESAHRSALAWGSAQPLGGHVQLTAACGMLGVHVVP